MRVLLVDGDHKEGDLVAAQLAERGHDVVRCFDETDKHLCRGVHDLDACPLEGDGVDVTVLIRDQNRPPQLREMGAVCSIRHRVPVVEAYAHDEAPFVGYVTQGGTAVVEAVEEAGVPDRPGHEAAIEARLATVPAVARLGKMPGVDVTKDLKRLVVTLDLPTEVSKADVQSVVTWAVQAVRDYDPYTPVVDVVVHRI